MNRTQWLNWRFDGIGASDAAVVLKMFPYGKTPRELYYEKINRTITPSNTAMEHGKKYEDEALDWYERETACDLFRQIRLVSASNPFIRATIDGIDLDDKYLVEVKCPYNLENHQLTKETKKVPEIYVPQCQHQMYVAKVERMYFLSYNWINPDDSVIIDIFRDDKFIDNMINEHTKFWECIQLKNPPEMTEFDILQLDDDESKSSARYLKQAIQSKKNAEELIERYKAELMEKSRDRSCKCDGIRLTKSECKGFVDYASIPELKGVDLELYRKPSFEKWTARLIG
jgi:putative phage-type endonuclease